MHDAYALPVHSCRSQVALTASYQRGITSRSSHRAGSARPLRFSTATLAVAMAALRRQSCALRNGSTTSTHLHSQHAKKLARKNSAPIYESTLRLGRERPFTIMCTGIVVLAGHRSLRPFGPEWHSLSLLSSGVAQLSPSETARISIVIMALATIFCELLQCGINVCKTGGVYLSCSRA